MTLRFKHKVYYTLLPLLALPHLTHAETNNQHEQSLRNSEREINQQIERNRYQQLLKTSQQTSTVTEPETDSFSQACLPVNGLQLTGIHLLDEKDLTTLTPIPENCISDANVNRLIRELTQRYLDRGYITARMVFAPLDENRTLRLHAVEGTVESIEFEQHTALSSVQNVFPSILGKPLNIRELDQGLDQLNRLPSQQISVDILPGKQFGGSTLVLKNHALAQSPFRFYTTVDNHGKKNSGRLIGRVGFSWDNLTKHADFLSLHHSQNLDHRSSRYNRSYSGLYFIPYGYWTFSAFAARSDSAVSLPVSGAKYYGSSRQFGLRLDRVLSRNQFHINTLSLSLSRKQNSNVLLGYRNPDQNLRLTVLDLSFDHLRILDNGTLSLNLGMQHGLALFGASRSNKQRITEPQFTKFGLSASWQYPFSILDRQFQLQHRFAAQYSNDRLPSMETFDLTDNSALRGFDRLSLSSDNGWYLRNTLSYPAAYKAVSLTPFIGLDTGRIFNRNAPNAWQSAVGTSFGIHLSYRQLSGSFSFDRGWFVSSPERQNESQFLGKITITF
ncbi:ShlB/FhaC/HecB family hemolysin secretion/activation protein [Testudinibacter sp. TR-2022]|uniref:ShlB/FhaC/HecB family hemolysin secretion/activation protein n=1 Tax=Testudinibacter sp. TR-2022 TaxID=2585029 RepID=UPI001119B116|nr:ShlB/FhaC/HecB family hemolysin secretion/activation protein [Testudinibacter sp. TR-2022]TNH04742.1 ShlB/FhaC/HecB family hemolysin secretion/activation protein [Pasteurellaceae bacterium Phil31]TNH10475.1 ShlB/FhaC/HecB family hemolysin secretion/activation protein [Testudinibacter sp. TR-2022]TNH12934.1 ShlB/FhaC/HecB family hemolysin secretion/activation protein [Testudinibacter sp. TR-2022]TNH13515.1 ShlB/FhaC/HecB family hemolysin secretion/activation protein [Testudinibacter sp. TR-20